MKLNPHVVGAIKNKGGKVSKNVKTTAEIKSHFEKNSSQERLSKNKSWKAAYDKASGAIGNIYPKDSEHSTGINWKGEEKHLTIQGKGFQELYNLTADKDTYLEVEELKNHPLVKQMDEMSEKCKKAVGETYEDKSPEREALRESILEEFRGIGSAKLDESGKNVVKDENGKVIYDGEIKKEKKACIVIGLPACGKSTAHVDKWSAENGAFVMDSDVIKSLIPEYAATNGLAGDAVHEESSDLNKRALAEFVGPKDCSPEEAKKASRNGENLCIPIIGNDEENLKKKYIERLEKAGYDVEIKYAEGSAKTSANRVVNRAIQGGRIIRSDVVLSYGDTCPDVYKSFEGKTNAQGNPYIRPDK